MKVEVEGCKVIDSHFTRNDGYSWSALTLIEAAKDYEPFDLPLAGIDISVGVWSGVDTIKGFTEHVKRVKDTDLKYPIILDDRGVICDGWHRIVKALILGKTYIKAIRLQQMPSYDSYAPPE